MVQCFEFFDLKSCIMTFFDTPLLDTDGSHMNRLGTASNLRRPQTWGFPNHNDSGSSHGERNVMSGIPSWLPSGRPRRIPTVAIYWWRVYPQEWSAYTSYPLCPTFTHYSYQIDPVAGTVSDQFQVYALNLRTGKVTDVLTGHNGPVCGLEFHPDESLPFVEEIPSHHIEA